MVGPVIGGVTVGFSALLGSRKVGLLRAVDVKTTHSFFLMPPNAVCKSCL